MVVQLNSKFPFLGSLHNFAERLITKGAYKYADLRRKSFQVAILANFFMAVILRSLSYNVNKTTIAITDGHITVDNLEGLFDKTVVIGRKKLEIVINKNVPIKVDIIRIVIRIPLNSMAGHVLLGIVDPLINVFRNEKAIKSNDVRNQGLKQNRVNLS